MPRITWRTKPEEKKLTKADIPKKDRHYINLPLKIPQNIIDTLQKYWDWRDNPDAFEKGRKPEILDEMGRVCRRWHLYSGFEASAGTFWIHTKVGITIIASYGNYPTPPYCQIFSEHESFNNRRVPEHGEEIIFRGKWYKFLKEDESC